MSSGAVGSFPVEEKRPSFLRRPVPMWAFLIVVVILILLFVVPFFSPLPPSIQQPLVVTPETRTVFINQTQTVANFTVANLNTTNSITAIATVRLSPANANITLTILGVQTRNTFVQSADGKTVTFPLGVSTLVVKIVPSNNMKPANYVIQLTLVD